MALPWPIRARIPKRVVVELARPDGSQPKEWPSRENISPRGIRVATEQPLARRVSRAAKPLSSSAIYAEAARRVLSARRKRGSLLSGWNFCHRKESGPNRP